MQGLLTAVPETYYTGAGKITNTDIQDIFFSVNAVHRASNLCSWLMSDTVLQRIRLATDTSSRPLINIRDGNEYLMGKPVHVSPSLGAIGGSLALNSNILFGNFEAFHIRASKPTIQRSINSTLSDITRGQSLYIARIRCDSAIFDASNGGTPPIVNAFVTA